MSYENLVEHCREAAKFYDEMADRLHVEPKKTATCVVA